LDPRLANAEVQRRRVEIDTKKWTFAKMQPRGVRHKKEDVDQQQGPVMLVWGQQDGEPPDQAEPKADADVVRLVANDGESTR